MRNEEDILQDASAMAQLIADAAGWSGEKAATWIAAFVDKVRFWIASDEFLGDDDGIPHD